MQFSHQDPAGQGIPCAKDELGQENVSPGGSGIDSAGVGVGFPRGLVYWE